MVDEEEPRAQNLICGVTHIGPLGIEWICIKPPHAAIYYRRKSDKTHKRGDPIFSNAPNADRHYMVNRWPNRKKAS